MQLTDIAFGVTDWQAVPTTVHPGEHGSATWRTVEVGNVRVRMVELSPGYLADHWCQRGHVVLVLEGEVTSELADGRSFVLGPGMGYQVADGASSHRSRTAVGARMFIVD